MTEPRDIIKVINRIREEIPEDVTSKNLKGAIVALKFDLDYVERCAKFRAPEAMSELWGRLAMMLANRLNPYMSEPFTKQIRLLMRGKIQ